VTVNLDDREYRELSALAEKHRVSLAWLGRQATIEFLERHAQDGLQLPLDLSSERRAGG
jgi:predicted transcriptional regulator